MKVPEGMEGPTWDPLLQCIKFSLFGSFCIIFGRKTFSAHGKYVPLCVKGIKITG